ncbi:MAG: hypothetical protein AAF670_19205 [Planctomycetota bacterium]
MLWLVPVWVGAMDMALAGVGDQPDGLAKEAIRILDYQCASCHDGQNHPLDTLDHHGLTAERSAGRDRFIEPGDPESSYLWKLVQTDVMPKDAAPLSDEEKQTIRDWIVAGAEFPDFGGTQRTFISEAEVLGQIEQHLNGTRAEDREFIRYFSLHTIANNRTITSDKLRLAAAGLAKALNSLSRQRNVAVLEAIDDSDPTQHAGLLFAVDLRQLGWEVDNFEKWKQVLAAYPYGKQPSRRGEARRSFDNIKSHYEVRSFFDGFAYLRADWFIASAMRPPLYHELLDVPETVAELELAEGFDQESDYLRNQLVRGGVLLSNVSTQPRVVDYHAGERGIWMSYDFVSQPANDPERGDIVRFPLGPQFANNPHPSAAFEHAGGEIIFTLPNGLHGYMLVDADGRRIDAGPIEIVADRSMVSGTPEIVNGVSCISCHRHGMIDFNDQIAFGHAQTSQSEVVKIESIYRPDALQRRLDEQRADYLRSLRRVIGRFLQVGDDAGQPIEAFPEPITTVTRLYQRDLDDDQIAAELGLPDPSSLNQMIGVQTKLISLGLGVLPDGGAIKRNHWEARGLNNRESKFQRAAREFGFTPVSRLSVR